MIFPVGRFPSACRGLCRVGAALIPRSTHSHPYLDTIPRVPKIRPSVAAMAELADALGSGPSTRKGVQVQLLLAAFKRNPINRFSMASYGVFLWVRANRIEERISHPSFSNVIQIMFRRMSLR